MNARLDAKCLRRELHERFPKLKIMVRVKPRTYDFNIIVFENASRVRFSKIKQVVAGWYFAAYGTKVRFGAVQSRPARWARVPAR